LPLFFFKKSENKWKNIFFIQVFLLYLSKLKNNNMNFLQDYLKFDTIEEGENFLQKALSIRDQMGGALYWNICNDDCKEIYNKVESLKRKEQSKIDSGEKEADDTK
jgi:hypothetical protein